jgi:hypothetical protein
MEVNKRRRFARMLFLFRKVHRTTGALLFVFFIVVAVTGLLLGWKKHSAGLILPKSYKGTSTNLAEWLPIDSLHKNACKILHDSVDKNLKLDLERIDVRPQKGMVKFVFLDHFWGVQIDGVTGKLLHIERRRSDFIENIHDGSIFDYLFDTNDEQIKLGYTSIMGFALLLFSITGFWLWYGPKRLKKK